MRGLFFFGVPFDHRHLQRPGAARRAGVWLDGKHCAVVARRLYVNIKEADKWIQSQISPRRLA